MKTQIIIMAAAAIPTAVYAQQITYFDADWQVITSKDKMEFYRETTKEGNLYRIKDFYKNGALQMDGLSHTPTVNNEIWEGKVSWYNEDGSLEHYSHYKKGDLDGETYSTRPNGDYSRALYRKNELISGESLDQKTEDNYSIYQKRDNSNAHIIYFDQDIKGIRYELFINDDGRTSLTKNYDKGGKLIGQYSNDSNGVNGTLVDYAPDPMRVRQIEEYKDNELLSKKVYYTNEGLQSEYLKTDTSVVETAYDPSGKQIAKLQYKKDEDASIGFYPYDGLQIVFDGDQFYHKNYFKNGFMYKAEGFKEGILWQSTDYYETDGNRLPTRLTTYHPNGSVRYVLNYKMGEAYDGTYIDSDVLREYKDGKMISEIGFYEGEKIHFTKERLGENEYKGSTYLQNGKKYNDFTIKTSDNEYFTGTVTPYQNDRPGNTFVFVNGLMQKNNGKMRYYTDQDAEPVEIENDGKNYYLRTFVEGEISKEVRIPAKFIGYHPMAFQEADVFRTEPQTITTTVVDAAEEAAATAK